MLPRLAANPRLRRCVAWGAIALWLLPAAGFFLYPLTGDVATHPLAYFWTWDMFPGYETVNFRWLVIAETDAGDWRQIYPGPQDRFPMGRDGELRRLDLYADVTTGDLGERTRELLQRNLSAAGVRHRFTRVVLVRQQQPPRMSLAADLYQQAYGELHPHRHEWVIVQEAPVADNRIDWERAQ